MEWMLAMYAPKTPEIDTEKTSSCKKSWLFRILNACIFVSALQKTEVIRLLLPPITAHDPLSAARYATFYGGIVFICFVLAFFVFSLFEGWINHKCSNRKPRTAIKFFFTLFFFVGSTALGITFGLVTKTQHFAEEQNPISAAPPIVTGQLQEVHTVIPSTAASVQNTTKEKTLDEQADDIAKAVLEKAKGDRQNESLKSGIDAANRGDYATALRLLRPLAEEGDSAAQFQLGDIYGSGRGTPRDCIEAAKWYRKVIEQGFKQVQYQLGLMYYCGGGKIEGAKPDFQEAKIWFQKAADTGNVQAFSMLGFMFENGNGVEQNYVEAVQWYRKGAERGDAESQESLGDMYESGRGVPQDYIQAHMWYNLAASSDDAINRMARMLRDNLAAKMTPEQIAEAQKLAWKLKAK